MVSLRLFAIILTTLICRQIADETPLLVWRNSVVAVLGMTLGMGLLFKSFALAALASQSSLSRTHRSHGWLEQKRRMTETVWCLLLPAALLATGWGGWWNSLEQRGWPSAIILLGYFLPTICVIVMLEITAAQHDQLVDEMQLAEATGAEGSKHWCTHFVLRLRLGEMAGLLICLAPVLLVASIADGARSLTDGLAPEMVAQSWHTVAAACITITTMVLAFPTCLSRLTRARRIAGSPLAGRVAELTARLDIRGLQPLLVSSDGRWVGAAIVGWIPHFRKLWLSDGLVAQLSGRELDMVILHELAHVARRHFLWRTVPLLVSVALMATAWMALQHLTHGGQELAPWQFLFCGCAGIAIVATLGAAARRCELDADYWACTLALDACEWSRGAPQLPSLVLSAALEKLLSQEPDRNRATWLHPSLDRRLKGLADWRQDHRASR